MVNSKQVNTPPIRPFPFQAMLLVVFMIVSLSSCGPFKEVQVTQISGVKVVHVGDKGVELELGMKINNPNSYGFSIFRSSFDIVLSGTDLGTARLSKREHIAAHSEEFHTFHITTTMDKLLKGGLGSVMALFGTKNPEIEIKGNLKVGKFLIHKSIPVDRKQKINLENPFNQKMF
jgi:LEA14-like dessication related protein